MGAIASQFETNPNYGPRGLALLAAGKTPEETLKQLLQEDGNFDGEGPESRQIGVVSLDGKATAYTGAKAAKSDWAGARGGQGYSIQGNGLAGSGVVDAMEKAYLQTSGSLAERLLAALEAGDVAGGQRTGRESAALLVRTPDGFPLDIDLRVDHATDPVGDLRTLFNIQTARGQVIQAGIAARRGQFDQAEALLTGSVARAPMWPRVWIRAARVAEDIEEPELALQYITIAFSQNPAWANAEIGDGNYAALGARPMFHRWVSDAQEQHAVGLYRQLVDTKDVSPEMRVDVAKVLLEVGHADDALVVLAGLPQRSKESTEIWLLRADAFAASGHLQEAIEQCGEALKRNPHDLRAQRRKMKLELDVEIDKTK